MALKLFSLNFAQVVLQIIQKYTPKATIQGDRHILDIPKNQGSDLETVPFMSEEDMNKGGHTTLKYEQNNAHLQDNHGCPTNAWCRCIDAYGHQISTCMQSPTNGL